MIGLRIYRFRDHSAQGEVMVAYDNYDNVVDVRIGNNTIFRNSQKAKFKNRINITDFSNTYRLENFQLIHNQTYRNAAVCY